MPLLVLGLVGHFERGVAVGRVGYSERVDCAIVLATLTESVGVDARFPHHSEIVVGSPHRKNILSPSTAQDPADR